jgi:hypothetical protein
MGFIDTDLGALSAVDAVFSPGDFGLIEIFHLQRGNFWMNMIFLWHNLFPSFLYSFLYFRIL